MITIIFITDILNIIIDRNHHDGCFARHTLATAAILAGRALGCGVARLPLLFILIFIIILLLIVLSPQAQRSPLQARQRLHQDTVGRIPGLKLQQNLREKKCLFTTRWDPAGLLAPRGQPPLEKRGETRASLVSFLLTPPFFSSSI